MLRFCVSQRWQVLHLNVTWRKIIFLLKRCHFFGTLEFLELFRILHSRAEIQNYLKGPASTMEI